MKYLLLSILAVLFMACKTSPDQARSIVNFAHLEHLTEEILFEEDTVAIVHIYSQFPEYRWMDAKESGPEGIACVDDASRAAVLYLRHYELTGNAHSARRAKLLLRFVLKMQAEDGEFYNFIFADHSINRDGKTSYKSFGWWAARAVWALSHGSRALRESEPSFSTQLKIAVEKTFPHIASILRHYGEFAEIRGFRVPRWLLYQYDEYSAAATSELVLGLCEFYRATAQPEAREYIEKFAEAFLALQAGDAHHPPYGAFLSEAGIWHDWANGQTQALVVAGKLLNRPEWINAAGREVRWFYSRHLIGGRFREWNLATGIRSEFPQIAYGLRPMVVGSLRLAEATSKQEYETLAGLLASWFLGNNAAGKLMYDANTGRCYDGLEDSVTINLNAGAESTIEALYSLLEVEQSLRARQVMDARLVRRETTANNPYAVFETNEGTTLTLMLDTEKGDPVIIERKRKSSPE